MRNLLWPVLTVLLSVLPLCAWAAEIDSNSPQSYGNAAKAVVILCEGTIDDGLHKSIRRRTALALEAGADYIIYEIDTYGGFAQSAVEISDDLVLEYGKEVHTVAYVTTKAISAGAMISVSCKDIVMRRNTTIGDCAPIVLGGQLEGVEREKQESFIRGIFERAAQANGYPAALLKAMVTMQTEVHRIRNLQTGRYEFFEADKLPSDPNKYDLDNEELVVGDNEILTLTAFKAVEYGVARAQVEDRQGVLDFLTQRDAVVFADEPAVLKTNWSEEMVRWLNSPTILGILIMVAMLGVYIELSTPGIGLPGLVAAICFAVMIGSKYLVGLANWLEVAMFIIGLLLLIVELLILPGFGIAGTLGIVCMLLGLFGMLIKNPPDRLPWPHTAFDWQLLGDYALALAIALVGFSIAAWLLARFMPKVEFLSGLILVPTAAAGQAEAGISITAPPEIGPVTVAVGDRGRVVSSLRPAGKARFGDAVVDVVATAEFLDKGTKVEIIEIHGNRVVVRKIEEES